MRSRLAACAILLCTALAGAACGSAFHQEDENAVRPSDRETTVRVQNNNWSDMRIYLVRSGIRTRLGYVSSMTESSLNVSGAMVGAGADVRLMAAPIGSLRGFYSDPLQVSPGQTVEWQLENNLRLSSLRIW